MSLSGTRIADKIEYISDRDDKKSREEGATIFTIGALTLDARTEIQDGGFLLGTDNTMRMQVNRQNLQAVRLGLKNVEQFFDDSGKEIAYETEPYHYRGKEMQVPTDAFLSMLPREVLNELGQAIININTLSGKERKNSSTQS